MSQYKQHTRCRVCWSEDMTAYLDLGELPLSNNLCSTPYEIPGRYPLQVMLCNNCGLSQLSIVVDPEVMFSHYVYRSSINKPYVEHCRQMAKDLKQVYGLTNDSSHIDIACNDGALLNEFREEIGLSVLGVDPAKNLSAICNTQGIPIVNDFWSESVAEKILFQQGYADLITATNVFAHVDDVYDFMKGVKRVLKSTGVLILEFPYLKDFIDNREFDTIYQEHVSYFSIKPLVKLCNIIGLNVMRVEKQEIHGGSVRVHIGYGEHDDSVRQFILKEHELTTDSYKQFASDAYYEINNFRESLTALKESGKRICAFGSSAKGNTLLNCAGVNFKLIDRIYDETPEKQGKFYPGTMIEIFPIKEINYYRADYMVILSWNFKDSIIKKCRDAGYEGKFIIPIPKFTVIE